MATERLTSIKTSSGKTETCTTCTDTNISGTQHHEQKSISGLYNEHDDD